MKPLCIDESGLMKDERLFNLIQPTTRILIHPTQSPSHSHLTPLLSLSEEGRAETKPAGRKGSSSSSPAAEEDDDGTVPAKSANPQRGRPRARLPLLRRSGSPPSSVGCAPGSRRPGEGRSGSSPRPRPQPRHHRRPRCGLPLCASGMEAGSVRQLATGMAVNLLLSFSSRLLMLSGSGLDPQLAVPPRRYPPLLQPSLPHVSSSF
uniref:Uncharacterized protein n=1 Tax=Oryza meridionalis TaxID=40149 RepID=A0A0E0F5Z5_9ORYZ